jgi:hypothetical protein
VPESPIKVEVSPDVTEETTDPSLDSTHDANTCRNAEAEQSSLMVNREQTTDRPPQQAEGHERKQNVPLEGSLRSNKRKSESALDGNRSRLSLSEPPHIRGTVSEGSSDNRSHTRKRILSRTWAPSRPRPEVDPYGFEDPLADAFWEDVWVASAVYNVSFFFLILCLSGGTHYLIDRNLS